MATRLGAAKAILSSVLALVLSAMLLFVPSASLASDPALKPFVVGTIQVGTKPIDAAVSADGTTAYVVNNGSDTVSKISLATNQVTGTIHVGTDPTSIAISPNGLFALVTNYMSDNVTRINLTNDTTSTITTATGFFDGPRSVVFSPINGVTRAYISNNDISTITELNLDSSTGATTSVGTITINPNPADLVISKDGNTLYSSHVGANRISKTLVNASPITTSFLQLSAGALPVGIELTSNDSRLYVAQSGLGSIAVIDTSNMSLVTQINGFSSPRTLTINPAGTQMFVADSGTDKVKNIDIATNIVSNQTLDVGTDPEQVTFVSNGLTFLTANFGSANVSVIEYFQVRTLAFATTSYTLAYGSTQSVTATPSAGVGNGTLTYSAGSSTACSVNSSTGLVTVTRATGTCTIQASISEGDAGVNVAPFQAVATATTPVTITPQTAPLGITAGIQTVVFGGTVTPSYSITSGALVSPDAISGVTYTYQGTGSTNYPASTTPPTAIGTYSVTPSNAVFSSGLSSNYAITYAPGSLTISTLLPQTVTWAPSNTQVLANASPLTPSVLATSSGTGNITYSVQSDTTSQCTVGSSTGVVNFTSAGVCVIRATASANSTYTSAYKDVTFTIGTTTTSMSLTLDVAVGNAVSNAPVDYATTGMQPGASWNLVLRSTPQTLASGNIGSLGAIAGSTAIPAGLSAGWHSLTLSGTSLNGGLVSTAIWFEVSPSGTLLASQTTEPPEDSITPAGLPKTGFEVVNVLVVALNLVLIGLFLSGIRRISF